MKITRTINGITYNIELLPEELMDAFFEQRDKFDIEDVVSYAEMFSPDEIEKYIGCTYSELLDMKEEIAAEMRRNIDKYDMEFSYAREEAVRDVVHRNKVVIA